MKKTRLLALLRNIWATRVSYFSILVFVALGIGIFLGIKWNQPAFQNSAHTYYETYKLHDYNIKFPFGITEEDLAAIRAMEEISLAEGGYTAAGVTERGGEHYVLNILSTTESLNLATAREGALPRGAHEIGVERAMADALGLRVGESITVESPGMEGLAESFLLGTEFTISGIVEHPAYIRRDASRSRGLSSLGDGMADYYVLLSPAAFDTAAFDNCYSNVYIRCDSLRGLQSFGDAYKARLDGIAESLYAEGRERGLARAGELRARLGENIAEAKAKIADGEAEIADGAGQIAQGEARLAAEEAKADEGEIKIREGEETLEGFRAQIADGARRLEEGRAAYNKARQEYNRVSARIKEATGYSADELYSVYRGLSSEARAAVREVGDVNAMLRQKRELDNLGAQLREGEAELEAGRAELAAQETELEARKQELADGRAQIEAGRQELLEKQAELEAGRAALEEGREALAKLEAGAEKLELYDDWMLEKRTGNLSYHILETYSGISERLCYSLALLFVFVGVMISYTSIARIVQEQRPLIGVQKSLGFTRREVTAQYLAYALSAVALGSVLGGALGYFGVEAITNNAYAKNHIMGSFAPYFSLPDLLGMALIEMLLIGFAAWLGCRRHLAQSAVALMRKDPGSGKGRRRFYENWAVWNKASLYTQTIVNNLMNDRNRVIATLVGVVGCTALLVMALGVQASIRNTPRLHFERIWSYDARLLVDEAAEEADTQALFAALEGTGLSHARAYKKLFFIEDEAGNWINGDVLVPEGTLEGYIQLRDASDRDMPLAVPEEGVLINETYTRYHDIAPGDTLTLMDMNGQRYALRIAGITEHYLSANQIVMSPAYYEKAVGPLPAANSAYIQLGDTDFRALEERLAPMAGFMALRDDRASWTATFESLQSTISLMVSIALLLAVVMALLVLLNLNVVLINEKSMELIIMRINGFSVAEAKAYIYRDNIVLTALGIVLGVGVGLLLSTFVIGSVRSENTHLIADPNLTACLMGAAISALFALITNLIALRRVGRLKASDLTRL